MTRPGHPARAMAFNVLWDGLQRAVAEKRVKENIGADGLRLYCYTESTVYERTWDEFTMLARGIILDPAAKRIVATPFPKFFNVGERLDSIPDLPFETFEKFDGSLIILFHHNGEWRTATKGSLNSEQARWAKAWIDRHDLSVLDRDTTYLAEAIYPENRIVVQYALTGLFILGAYRGDGSELDYAELRAVADSLDWSAAIRHPFDAVSELLVLARTLPSSEEGFVLRFSNGLRLKVKGDEYCRIHRMVSGLSPLSMWGAMQDGKDLEDIRRQLPEEFWHDFDTIVELLQRQIDSLVADVAAQAELVTHLTDKEVGLMLTTFPERVRRFVFPFRKGGGDLLSGRTRDVVFRAIRPDANRLEGYRASSAVNRVQSEAA